MAVEKAPRTTRKTQVNGNGHGPNPTIISLGEITPGPAEVLAQLSVGNSVAEIAPQGIVYFPTIFQEGENEIVDSNSADGSIFQLEGTIVENGNKKRFPEASNEIVERAKAGDKDALADLYLAFRDRIYRYVLARTGDPHLAEDLTGDIVEQSILNLRQYQARQGSVFTSWVFRIAHNEIINYGRKKSTRVVHIATDSESAKNMQSESNVELEVEQKDQIARIIDVLPELTDPHRQVMVLRFFAGLDIAETARAMGRTENNVSVLQHRAINEVKEILGVTEKVEKEIPEGAQTKSEIIEELRILRYIWNDYRIAVGVPKVRIGVINYYKKENAQLIKDRYNIGKEIGKNWDRTTQPRHKSLESPKTNPEARSYLGISEDELTALRSEGLLIPMEIDGVDHYSFENEPEIRERLNTMRENGRELKLSDPILSNKPTL